MKKTVSFLCVLAMLLSTFCVGGISFASAASGEQDGYVYSVMTNGNAKITAYIGSLTVLSIPRTLGGYPVTCIDSYAFQNSSSIQNVIVPSGVTSIGVLAFSRCYSLQSVTLPNSVTSIGLSAFSGCTSLRDFTIPSSIAYIEEGTFSGCTSLVNVSIPEGVSSIGEGAFFKCSSLIDVTIPKSVTSISTSAFNGCTSIASIKVIKGNPTYHSRGNCLIKTADKRLVLGCVNSVIPSDGSVTSFFGAFDNCRTSKYFGIPNGLTLIGDHAFYGWKSLSAIAIPKSMRTIDAYAFDGCVSLQTVYYGGSESEWNAISIGSYNTALTNATVYYNCPDTYATDYKAILKMFQDSIACKWSNRNGKEWKNPFDPDNVTYMFPQYYQNATLADIGYALIDIDQNGQAELMISPLRDAEFGSIFDMYTIVNGVVVHTAESGERSMHSLTDTGWVYYHGSGGAASSATEYLTLDSADGKLHVKHAFIYDGWYDAENPNFYASRDYYNEETYETDYTAYTRLTEAEYQAIESQLPNQIPIPMTPLSEYDPNATKAGLAVYTDITNLTVRKGNTITLSASILDESGKPVDDASSISFYIDNPDMLSVSYTKIDEGQRCVRLRGEYDGKTMVVFNNSQTGEIVKVPITVYSNEYMSYTLNSVPEQNIEKYTTNFYNVDGIYVDNYTYSINSDQTANVSFDVYNTNYSYGVVEILDENGCLKDAILIDKMTSSSTSIKEAVWDNTGYLIRDIFQGDLLTYRQESGVSKKTPITARVPKNGYIKICMDSNASFIAGAVNAVDGLMMIADLSGDIKKYNASSKEFSEKLTKKIVNEAIFAELVKDGSDAADDLWKNVGGDIFFTKESMGNYTASVTKNLDELNLGKVVAETAWDFGWNVGENVFTYFAGPAGVALNVIFTLGKAENLILHQHDLEQTMGVGSIYIQNQGGGRRACQQIEVESADVFSDDVALNVYQVTLEADYLDLIEIVSPKVHEAITNGTTQTYNISLVKNGEETQPDSKVTVYIPIPDKLKALAYLEAVGSKTGKVKVYRVEEDGSLTEMDATIDNGCFVFETDHFSLYTLVGYDGPSRKTGDMNGDDALDMRDAFALYSATSGASNLTDAQKATADMNGDGAIDMRDAFALYVIVSGG